MLFHKTLFSNKLNNSKVKFYFILFFCLFYHNFVSAIDTKHCDSMIKTGVELMFQKKHVKSIELLSGAKTIATKNKWYKQLFLAQNNIANNYYMMLDYGEALEQYFESYKVSQKYLDANHTMIVLNNIAILYSKEKNYDKANENFFNAYTIAKKNKDSLKIGLYALNLGNLSNDENKLEKAHKYFLESLQYTQHPEIKTAAKIGLSLNDFLSGRITKSRLTATDLLSEIKNDKNNINNRITLTSIIAKSYLKENDLSSALKWTNIALSEKPNLESKVELQALLSNIYFGLKSYNLAFQYKDSINLSNIELNKIKNSKLFESNSVKFQIQSYKEKILEKEYKLKSERRIFYSILIVVVFGIIIIILIFRNRLIENKQKQLIAISEQKTTALKLEKEKAFNFLLVEKEKTAMLEQERLKNEITLKNQKILSKEVYQSGRNLLLEDIIKSISIIPRINENKNVINYIEALKQHMKNDDNWENYVRHFNEVNQDFIKKLIERHPDLTTTDIRYISYVYMNLDTKEIATILNITPVACRKRKERIEKRLKLSEDISLNAYLMSI